MHKKSIMAQLSVIFGVKKGLLLIWQSREKAVVVVVMVETWNIARGMIVMIGALLLSKEPFFPTPI